MLARQAELERLVRYCHPPKILATTRLPCLEAIDDEVLASLYGTSRDGYRVVAAELAREARLAARELRDDETVRQGIESLPLSAGERVVAFGDSHTDDLASWAEILRHLLATVRPGDDIRVVNAGLSGDTTTAALGRLRTLPSAALGMVLLGTNDARRDRRGGAPMLVSDGETRRNLRAIDEALQLLWRRVVWITPPPVDDDRIAADPGLADAGVTWRLDDVHRKADLVRDVPGVIDLWPTLRSEHLAPDGLHPSEAGQRLIVERVLASLG